MRACLANYAGCRCLSDIVSASAPEEEVVSRLLPQKPRGCVNALVQQEREDRKGKNHTFGGRVRFASGRTLFCTS
eukprot:449493-Pleurochrysis_carterae.AAC.2